MLLKTLTPVKTGQGWSPTDKSGLVFWFDATAITGLSNGNPISTWTDSSGALGANATQSGTARPTYQTNIQNGKPGVLFTSSSSQFFTLSSAIPSGWAVNAPLSVVAIIRPADKGAGSQFGLVWCIATATNTTSGGGGSKRQFAGSIVEGNATFGDFWNCFPDNTATTGVYITPGQITTNAAVITSYNGSGVSTAANYEMRFNNASQTETASGTGATVSTNSYIGAWVGTGSPSLFYNGYIFELIGYNTTMTGDDWANLSTYISSKWGITQS